MENVAIGTAIRLEFIVASCVVAQIYLKTGRVLARSSTTVIRDTHPTELCRNRKPLFKKGRRIVRMVDAEAMVRLIGGDTGDDA